MPSKSKAGNDMTDLNAEQGFLSQNALDPKIFSNQSSSIKSEPFLITLETRADLMFLETPKHQT